MSRFSDQHWALSRLCHKFRLGIEHPHRIKDALKTIAARQLRRMSDGAYAAYPQTVKLYVNTACNAQCIMCDIGQKNRASVYYKQLVDPEDNALSLGQWEQLIQELTSFKPKIHIHGMEPLLNKDLFKIIKMVKDKGLFLFLITNGILLPKFAAPLVAGGVDKIGISIDGTRKVHDQIRGEGVFDRAIEGISQLLYHRDLLGGHTEITSNFTISGWNYANIVAYADFMLNDIKIDSISITHPYYVSEKMKQLHNSEYAWLGETSSMNIHGPNLDNIDTQTLWKQLGELKQRFKASQVFFNIDFSSWKHLDHLYQNPLEPITKRTCTIPWQSTTITANGDVLINNRCFQYISGNVRHQSFRSIWKGEKYRRFRKTLKKNGNFPACLRCCGTAPRHK